MTSGSLLHTFQPDNENANCTKNPTKSGILSIHFHPNEFLMASGSADGTVRTWEMDEFQQVSCIHQDDDHQLNHRFDNDAVHTLLFDQDGSRLFSASSGGMLVKDRLN